MPELIAPTVGLHTAWLEAHAEWGPGAHEDGFGLLPSDEADSLTGFAAWVARLVDESDRVKAADAGRALCTYRWIVEGERGLGMDRVLVVCAVDDVASVKRIERMAVFLRGFGA